MPRNIVISVPQPCSQAWDEMSPVEKGRFCQHCQKTVIDYSTMSDKQMIAAITAHSCGRFTSDQLNRELIPAVAARKPLLFSAVLASFLAMVSPAAKAAAAPAVQLSVDTFSNQNKPIETEDSTGQLITGQVVDNHDNTMLQGVTIQLEGIRTNTDEKGNFRLFIPAEHFKNSPLLIARNIGYETIQVKLEINAQGTFSPLQLKMKKVVSGMSDVTFKQTRWRRFKNKLRWLISRVR